MARPYVDTFNLDKSTSSPVASTPTSYKTNVNRQKTKKWVEAKPVDYGGDDWGDEFDDGYGYDDEEPPPPPAKPTGFRQKGQATGAAESPLPPGPKPYGQLGVAGNQSDRAATNPIKRQNSFTAGDEKRAFSTGGPSNIATAPMPAPAPAPVELPAEPEPLVQSQLPSQAQSSPQSMGPPPPLKISTRPSVTGLRKAVPNSSQSPTSNMSSAGPQRARASSINTSQPQAGVPLSAVSVPISETSDYQARSDYSPSAAPAPLQARSPLAADTNAIRFPPRQSSISQASEAPDLRASSSNVASPVTQTRTSRSGSITASTSNTNSKPLPFIRPADIYQRIEEERQRDPSSSERGRSGLDSVIEATAAESANRQTIDSPSDSSRQLPLDQVRENNALESSKSNAVITPQEPASVVQQSQQVLQEHDTAQRSLEEREIQHIRSSSTSPKLPDLHRMSAFGMDFFNMSSAKSAEANEVSPTNNTSDLRREPSLGFTSMVNQAFTREDDASLPETPASRTNSTVQRSDSDSTGTAAISPIMSTLPNLAIAERIQSRENDTPTIEEEPEDSPLPEPAPVAVDKHRLSRDSLQLSFTPGHQRNVSTPSLNGSPAKTPDIGEASKELPEGVSPDIRDASDPLSPEAESPQKKIDLRRPSLPGAWISSYDAGSATPQVGEEPDEISRGDFSADHDSSRASTPSSTGENRSMQETTPTVEAPGDSAADQAATGLAPQSLERTVSCTSSVPPTPLPKDTPKNEASITDYFPGAQPLKAKTAEEALENEKVLAPIPRLAHTLSVNVRDDDQTSDKLRKEIVRQLSPEATDRDNSEAAPSTQSEPHRSSHYYPDDIYDNYRGSTYQPTADVSDAVEEPPLPSLPLEIYDASPVSPTKPTIEGPESGESSPAVDDLPPIAPLRTRNSPSPNRPISRKFSWEGDSFRATPEVSSQDLAATLGSTLPATGESLELSRTLDVPQPDTIRMVDDSSQGTRPDGSSFHSAVEDHMEEAAILAVGAGAVAAAAGHHGAEPQDSELRELEPHPEHDFVSPLSSEHPDITSPANQVLSPSKLPLPPSPYPPFSPSAKISSFKEITALGTAEERIKAFTETQQQFAAMDTGLVEWLYSLASEISPPGGYDQRPDSSGKQRNMSASSPPFQQPYFQQYLNASSPTTPVASSKPSGVFAGSQHGFSTGGRLSTQQVQAKSKDLLHTAGVFGGKASKAGKGLLAKGKNKFLGGGSGDKDNSTPPSSFPSSKFSAPSRRASWGMPLALSRSSTQIEPESSAIAGGNPSSFFGSRRSRDLANLTPSIHSNSSRGKNNTNDSSSVDPPQALRGIQRAETDISHAALFRSRPERSSIAAALREQFREKFGGGNKERRGSRASALSRDELENTDSISVSSRGTAPAKDSSVPVSGVSASTAFSPRTVSSSADAGSSAPPTANLAALQSLEGRTPQPHLDIAFDHSTKFDLPDIPDTVGPPAPIGKHQPTWDPFTATPIVEEDASYFDERDGSQPVKLAESGVSNAPLQIPTSAAAATNPTWSNTKPQNDDGVSPLDGPEGNKTEQAPSASTARIPSWKPENSKEASTKRASRDFSRLSGHFGRLANALTDRSSKDYADKETPRQLNRSEPSNQATEKSQSTNTQSNRGFIGLPPIRRTSTLKLSLSKKPKQRFPIDDDDEEDDVPPIVASEESYPGYQLEIPAEQSYRKSWDGRSEEAHLGIERSPDPSPEIVSSKSVDEQEATLVAKPELRGKQVEDDEDSDDGLITFPHGIRRTPQTHDEHGVSPIEETPVRPQPPRQARDLSRFHPGIDFDKTLPNEPDPSPLSSPIDPDLAEKLDGDSYRPPRETSLDEAPPYEHVARQDFYGQSPEKPRRDEQTLNRQHRVPPPSDAELKELGLPPNPYTAEPPVPASPPPRYATQNMISPGKGWQAMNSKIDISEQGESRLHISAPGQPPQSRSPSRGTGGLRLVTNNSPQPSHGSGSRISPSPGTSSKGSELRGRQYGNPRTSAARPYSFEQPPSSANRYPELFPSYDKEEGPGTPAVPEDYYQAPISREEAFLPRQQTSEYHLPGVGPPDVGEIRSSRRNSGILKDLGNKIRGPSRERRNSMTDDQGKPLMRQDQYNDSLDSLEISKPEAGPRRNSFFKDIGGRMRAASRERANSNSAAERQPRSPSKLMQSIGGEQSGDLELDPPQPEYGNRLRRNSFLKEFGERLRSASRDRTTLNTSQLPRPRSTSKLNRSVENEQSDSPTDPNFVDKRRRRSSLLSGLSRNSPGGIATPASQESAPLHTSSSRHQSAAQSPESTDETAQERMYSLFPSPPKSPQQIRLAPPKPPVEDGSKKKRGSGLSMWGRSEKSVADSDASSKEKKKPANEPNQSGLLSKAFGKRPMSEQPPSAHLLAPSKDEKTGRHRSSSSTSVLSVLLGGRKNAASKSSPTKSDASQQQLQQRVSKQAYSSPPQSQSGAFQSAHMRDSYQQYPQGQYPAGQLHYLQGLDHRQQYNESYPYTASQYQERGRSMMPAGGFYAPSVHSDYQYQDYQSQHDNAPPAALQPQQSWMQQQYQQTGVPVVAQQITSQQYHAPSESSSPPKPAPPPKDNNLAPPARWITDENLLARSPPLQPRDQQRPYQLTLPGEEDDDQHKSRSPRHKRTVSKLNLQQDAEDDLQRSNTQATQRTQISEITPLPVIQDPNVAVNPTSSSPARFTPSPKLSTPRDQSRSHSASPKPPTVTTPGGNTIIASADTPIESPVVPRLDTSSYTLNKRNLRRPASSQSNRVRSPAELEDTNPDADRSQRHAMQEDKMLFDPEMDDRGRGLGVEEADAPLMTATSFPGQVWNPFDGGEAGWEDMHDGH